MVHLLPPPLFRARARPDYGGVSPIVRQCRELISVPPSKDAGAQERRGRSEIDVAPGETGGRRAAQRAETADTGGGEEEKTEERCARGCWWRCGWRCARHRDTLGSGGRNGGTPRQRPARVERADPAAPPVAHPPVFVISYPHPTPHHTAPRSTPLPRCPRPPPAARRPPPPPRLILASAGRGQRRYSACQAGQTCHNDARAGSVK
ncbi:hypothetical protein B0H14DRAFT_1210781 [Mycena olivaceomarginata]|nr:hypothetical protein B0H14DRAFT_1210781 [Mycena olivaceomarginata]